MLLVVSEPHGAVGAVAIGNATFAAVAIRLRIKPPRRRPGNPAGERNRAYRDPI